MGHDVFANLSGKLHLTAIWLKKKRKKEELGFPSVTDDTNLQRVLVQIQLKTLRLFRANADSTGQLVVLFSSSSEALTQSSELFSLGD